VNWDNGCARCGKETQYQIGMVFNQKYKRHEIANWCSKECEEKGTGKSCSFPHNYKSKEFCGGSL
jgi:hypothetical protein